METVSELYVPAFWYAYGKTNEDISHATNFANWYAERVLDNTHDSSVKNIEKAWLVFYNS
jgi:hypothetical protein